MTGLSETISVIPLSHVTFVSIHANGITSFLCVSKSTDANSVKTRSVGLIVNSVMLLFLASSSFTFDGQTIAYYDATNLPLHNTEDELRLRFKTNFPHGVLFYAKGTQNNDYLTVELRNGSVFVAIDLGESKISFIRESVGIVCVIQDQRLNVREPRPFKLEVSWMIINGTISLSVVI